MCNIRDPFNLTLKHFVFHAVKAVMLNGSVYKILILEIIKL